MVLCNRNVRETFQTKVRPKIHRSETKTLGILAETRSRSDDVGPRQDRDVD